MAYGATRAVQEALGEQVVSEIERLEPNTNALGIGDVILDLATVLVVAVLAIVTDFWPLTVVAAAYIGVKQRHLSNLGHELVHSKLVESRLLTKAAGNFVMLILAEPFKCYCRSHWRHHGRLGRVGDPMLESYVAGRAMVVCSSRLEFLFRVYLRSVVWRLPVEAILRWIQKGERESHLSRAMRLLAWVSAATLLYYAGHLTSLIIYWVLPLLFVRPAVTWLTDLGNHAGLIHNTEDPFQQTRGWTSGWLTRHLLGGHLDDMYHPVHHLFPALPWRKLPEAEKLLRSNFQGWSSVPWCSGFFFRRRSTPEIPCVWEDIIHRTNLVARADKDRSEAGQGGAQIGG
jgi:fatty acid desaturase